MGSSIGGVRQRQLVATTASLLLISTTVACIAQNADGEDAGFDPSGITTAQNNPSWWQHRGTITTLEGHSGEIFDVEYSPDGSTIASASADGTARLWKSDGTFITSLEGQSSEVLFFDVAYSPDGTTIASASLDNVVRLWESNGTFITSLEGHSGEVTAVAYSPDGSTIASASSDR